MIISKFCDTVIQWIINVSRIFVVGRIATHIYIAAYINIIILRGIARSLWSGHIIKVEFHCVGMIV